MQTYSGVGCRQTSKYLSLNEALKRTQKVFSLPLKSKIEKQNVCVRNATLPSEGKKKFDYRIVSEKRGNDKENIET